MMITINKLLKKARKKVKSNRVNKVMLSKPHRKGVITSVKIDSPRKPNSANRKVALIRFNDKSVTKAYIGGEGHNLQEHSMVLVKGTKKNDLTGIYCEAVRGILSFDPVKNRANGRSKYGVCKKVK